MNKEERNGLIKQRRLLREKCEEKDKKIESLQQILTNIKEYIENLGDIEDLHDSFKRIYKMVTK